MYRLRSYDSIWYDVYAPLDITNCYTRLLKIYLQRAYACLVTYII